MSNTEMAIFGPDGDLLVQVMDTFIFLSSKIS